MNKEFRRWLCTTFAFVLLAMMQSSACAQMKNRLIPYNWDRGWKGVEVDWKRLNVAPKTTFPVFGAPFEDAWRAKEGKASVSAEEPFRILEIFQNGEWALINYQIDQENDRIGWIRRPDGFRESDYGIEEGFLNMSLKRVYCEIDETCVLTDDPFKSGREIRKMEAGEKAIALCNVNAGEKAWTIIETEMEGKTVWGFVKSENLLDAYPYALEGNTLVIQEGVTRLGDYGNFDWFETDWVTGVSQEETEAYEEIWFPNSCEKGEIWGGCIDFSQEFDDQVVEYIQFPSTLKYLLDMSINFANLKEIRIPEKIEYLSPTFIQAVTTDLMIFPADYSLQAIPNGASYSEIGAWKVEEGNSIFRSDEAGALFSADGRILYEYSNGSERTNYDVPEGTEIIRTHAFRNNYLQTVSFPLGLKAIEQGAFSGCGELKAVTVPLAVEEIDPDAFGNCPWLQKLSPEEEDE